MELNQLDTFDRAWRYDVTWFEEPNNRRGGWSGVGRIALKLPDGGEVGAYLKRQENHSRRTLRHPFKGEPTFSREFSMLNYLSGQGVPAPKLLFFGEEMTDGRQRATLMTQELAGYRSLDEAADEMFASERPALAEQDALIRAVAKTVRKLHQAKIQHRSLYAKHIFIKSGIAEPDVVFIDLEKARHSWFSLYRTWLDLAALNRHSKHWSRTRRLYFYKQYLGVAKLTIGTKWLCRSILKRSRRG
jgi:lipopolysaccharide kinase (Kdo/WaaP) family protein